MFRCRSTRRRKAAATSVPVRDGHGEVAAALVVVGPTERLRERVNDTVVALRRTADDVVDKLRAAGTLA
ncbi:IclR family transcriptional regulator domain-containing protein [Vallicoccus soli]|uniref:IclR-ED domain-containing protein n=1 Tax=Vallicoccus soli TaxID=2339232 RepID=A0A3A3YTZ5_9ACTN|nr:IclR family transcriptional regulator C-terminal domain-containing protein [Vallicoccus soli]RJK92520.1 hypothetical protein D5H78_18760 [Vallicoccus soli]